MTVVLIQPKRNFIMLHIIIHQTKLARSHWPIEKFGELNCNFPPYYHESIYLSIYIYIYILVYAMTEKVLQIFTVQWTILLQKWIVIRRKMLHIRFSSSQTHRCARADICSTFKWTNLAWVHEKFSILHETPRV